MIKRIHTALTTLRGKLGLVPVVLLSLLGLYGLYVIKMHLGINIFPEWGLHLPGPRTLAREVAHAVGRL